MKPFTPFTSKLAPLPRANVDTDQITPARFLRANRAKGEYDAILFYDWRFDGDGEPRPDFVLNRPEHQGAVILLAGDNFGCGSSRETAPWALVDYGFRAVISSSFADIFRINSLKNGLLPIAVTPEVQSDLFARVEADPETEVEVHLESATLRLPDGGELAFEIDPFYQECLLKGVDQLGYLLEMQSTIEDFEARHTVRLDTTAEAGHGTS